MVRSSVGEVGTLLQSRRGAGLVTPRVLREPGAGAEVGAGGVVGVHVTPLGSRAVHRATVSLDQATRVTEGEGGALATTVGQRGGRLQTV